VVTEFRIVNSPKNRVIIEYAKKYAFNASRAQIVLDGDSKPYHEMNATWKNDGGVWYIDSLTDQYRIKDEELRIDKDVRVEMRVGSFQPNAKVPPETFTLAALEMPPGTRILDQRPAPAPREPHYVPYKDKELEKKLDGMVAQLKSLPTERPHTRSGSPPAASGQLWVWAANAAILAAIIAFLLIWRYRAKARSRTPERGPPP
jgi:hypothetical protein